MASSPGRRSDALKDSEARVRALTREVGSLREDLRRETKRRERAVSQSQQNEQANEAAQQQLQQILYANKKLASELDAAHEAARAAAQRDRTTLANLRENLAKVEQQVTQRGRQGGDMVSVARQRLDSLAGLLLEVPGVTVIGPSLAQQVTSLVADMGLALSSLNSLLIGGADSMQAAQGTEGTAAPTAASAANSNNSAAALGVMHASVLDAEKEHLKDEVARLRAQLRALVDKAAGAAGAASSELQALLRESQSEAISLRSEVAALSTSLQSSNQEAQLLRSQIATLQAKLSVHEVAEHQAVMAVGELSAVRAATETQVLSLQDSLSDLQQAYEAAIHENGTLKGQVESLTRQLHLARARIDAMQSSLSEQQADVAQAMQLVAQAAAAKGRHAQLSHDSAPPVHTAGLKRGLGAPLPGLTAALRRPHTTQPATEPTSPWQPRLHPGPRSVASRKAYSQHAHSAHLSHPHPQPQAPSSIARAAAVRHLLRTDLGQSDDFFRPSQHHTMHTVSPTRPATQLHAAIGAMRPGGAGQGVRPVHIPTTWQGKEEHVQATEEQSQQQQQQQQRREDLGKWEASAASAAAAATAAAAIAARLKAQQAAALAQRQPRVTNGLSKEKQVALATLGSELGTALDSMNPPRHPTKAGTLQPGHTKLAGQLRQPVALDTASSDCGGSSSATSTLSTVSGASRRGAAAVGSDSVKDLHHLMRDMRGLDDEIAALEASMQAALQSTDEP